MKNGTSLSRTIQKGNLVSCTPLNAPRVVLGKRILKQAPADRCGWIPSPREGALMWRGDSGAHFPPAVERRTYTHTGTRSACEKDSKPVPTTLPPLQAACERNSAGPIMRPPFFKSARIYLKANLVKIHPYRSCKCITRTLQGDPSQHI